MGKTSFFIFMMSCLWITTLDASLGSYEIVPFDYHDEKMKEQLCAMVRDDQDIQHMTHETEESMRKTLSCPDLKGKINYFVCRATDNSATIYGYMSYGVSNAAYLVQDPAYKEGGSLLTNSNYVDEYIVLETVIAEPFMSLDNFAVHKDHRGKGIAQAMLSCFEQDCRKNGIRLLLLGVEVDNDKAIRAYAKYGFVFHPRFPFTMMKHLN